jgi:multicomponent K+:H+ antiporter subunit E
VLRAILPQPMMTLCLVVIWLILANTYTAGSVVMALLVGVVIPIFTHRFWPSPPRLRNPRAIVVYVIVVLKDIVLANVEVARIVLFKRNRDLQAGFVAVPLDLVSPEAITLLAGTITMTPGTLSADLSADGRHLLVHALHMPDAHATMADIKLRYESRLKEIFR